jgi:cytochrome c oxidase assembly protein subunit 15
MPYAAASTALPAPDRRLPLLRRLAWLCTVLMLATITLSAFMRLSQAGLGCADWPACYGQGLRDLQAGRPAETGEGVATAAARLAHRVVASTALLLVIAMAVACLSARPVPWREARIALALLALALFLAVLGRWSSDARLPAVTIGNLLGGFAMLALCVRLALPGTVELASGWRRAAAAGTALVVVQVALGGQLSASYAATSCPTGFADCLAAARTLPWSGLDPWREPQLDAAPPINPSGALALAVHGLAGIALALALVPLGLAALRGSRRGAGALLLAALALGLALGWAMASGGTTLGSALAHNLAAALLLVAVFALARGSSTG